MTVAEMLAAARRTLDTGQPGALSAGLDFLSTVWVYESVTARAPFVTRRGGALLLVIPPEFAERLGRVDEPALAILLHEMLHCLRGHLELWGLRDDDRWVWNIALDMQVDGLVVRRMLPATAPQAARLDVASSLSDPSVFSRQLSGDGCHFAGTRLWTILPHREANPVSARDCSCAKRPGQDIQPHRTVLGVAQGPPTNGKGENAGRARSGHQGRRRPTPQTVC